VKCEGGDDAIMVVLNRVRLYACIFNPIKFGEDWMKNKGVIVFTSKSTQTDTQTDRRTDRQTLRLQYPSCRGVKRLFLPEITES